MKRKVSTSKLPLVLVNMAMSADGKIATANRAVSTLGSARDHEHLLELRATTDAVMAGARTVDLAPINMGPGGARFQKTRVANGLKPYNLRVVVSGSASLNPKAELFRHQFSPIIILTRANAPKNRVKQLTKAGAVVAGFGKDKVDLKEALIWLRKEWGVKRLVCEGGGDLNAAMFEAGLVHELHLTLCPKLIGGATAPTIFEGTGFATLSSALRLKPKSVKRIGDEFYLVFVVSPKH